MELITQTTDMAKYLQEQFTSHPIMGTLSVMGGLTVIKKILSILKSTYDYTMRRSKDIYKRYGPGWAIITGGTDGIGLAYAKQLAASGFDICIIARNRSKLSAKAMEIKDYGIKNGFRKVEVKEVVFDFKFRNTPRDYEELGRELGVLKDIAILVNNVGTRCYLSYEDYTLDKLNEYVSVNILPQLMLSRILIPNMLKRGKPTAMIFISSILGHIELPYFGVQCATKAFTSSLAKNLALEYKSENIDILCVICGRVNTSIFPHKDATLVISAEKAAKSHLSQLGLTSETYGCWQHGVSAFGLLYCAKEGTKFKMGQMARAFCMKMEGIVKI